MSQNRGFTKDFEEEINKLHTLIAMLLSDVTELKKRQLALEQEVFK